MLEWLDSIAPVAAAIFALVSVLFGGKLAKIKRIIKEFSDIPVAINNALVDDKIDATELKKILAQVKEFIQALK